MNNVIDYNKQDFYISSRELSKQLKKQHQALKPLLLKHSLPYSVENLEYRGQSFAVYFLPLETAIFTIMNLSKNHNFKLEVVKSIAKQIQMTKDLLIAIKNIDIDIESSASLYVYIIQEASSGRYKIGISKNPEKRIRQLQTGNPDQLRLLGYFMTQGNGYQDEKSLHRQFSDFQLNSEWFSSGADITVPEVCR